MSYREDYMKIVHVAKQRGLVKNDQTYYEQHHILPVSLFPKWRNRMSNKVFLTGQEHFEVHKLLAKIYGGKMWIAFWRMIYDKREGHSGITPEEYEEAKVEIANHARERFLGKKKNPEAVRKSADSRRGSKRTEEQRLRIGLGAKNGMAKSDKVPDRSWFGKAKWYNNGIKSVRALECPEGFMPGRYEKGEMFRNKRYKNSDCTY